MKVEKFKVLLYLKKSGLDKFGKAPIMGRITVNRTMAQFSCKLSCTPELWNPRESRLNGKSKEAVETNARIEKLLLAVNAAFDSLVSRKVGFDATDVKNYFQGSMETQMTLMKMTDAICDDIKARIGIDRAKGTYPGYHYMRLTLGEFIRHRYKVKDLAFGQLTEQFIHDYQAFATEEKGYAIDTVRHHLAILKKICRLAYKKGYSEKCHFQHFALPKQSELERYKDETRETLFPIIHHPNMKRHMKALAALAGIKDNLCYHQARHSFASLITLEAGVPIETISRMLGHSDISTTQVYARVSPKKLFEDMDKFIKATEDFKLTL